MRTLASLAPSCPARAHGWYRVHETARPRAVLISFRAPRDHRHRPANLPNSDADMSECPLREVRGWSPVSNSCLLALSAMRVPDKIWDQKGSLNITTFAEYTRTLCMQTRCPTCRVRPACRRHNCRTSRRHHCRVLPSSCGGLKTLPRIRQRGIQSSPCSTQQERLAGEKEMKIVMASLDDAGRTTNLYRMMLDTAATAIPAAGFRRTSSESHHSRKQP